MAKVFDFGRSMGDHYKNFKFKVSFGDEFKHLGDLGFQTVTVPLERTIRNWTCPGCGHVSPDFGDKMLTCCECGYEVINVKVDEPGPLALGAP